MIQVNGKLRAEILIPIDETEEGVKAKAMNHPDISKHITGTQIKKTIYVKNRLINIVF